MWQYPLPSHPTWLSLLFPATTASSYSIISFFFFTFFLLLIHHPSPNHFPRVEMDSCTVNPSEISYVGRWFSSRGLKELAASSSSESCCGFSGILKSFCLGNSTEPSSLIKLTLPDWEIYRSPLYIKKISSDRSDHLIFSWCTMEIWGSIH